MLTEQHRSTRISWRCSLAARMRGRRPGRAVCRRGKQFGQLEAILKKMQCRPGREPRRFIKLDLEYYHVLLAEASNNKLLHDLLFMIRSQLSAAMLTFVTMPGGAALACKHHRALLKALQDSRWEGRKVHYAQSLSCLFRALSHSPREFQWRTRKPVTMQLRPTNAAFPKSTLPALNLSLLYLIQQNL